MKAKENSFESFEVKDIPLDKIVFTQNPRSSLKEDDVSELMQDMKQRGLLQPIGVMAQGNEYVFMFGSRRITSARKLGWKKIHAKVWTTQFDDKEITLISTVENIHRKDLTPTELGSVCTRLMKDYNLSPSEISARLSIPHTRVVNAMALYKELPKDMQHLVGFHDARGSAKQGIIPSTSMNVLLNVRRFLSLSDRQFEEIVTLVRRTEISKNKIQLGSNLVKFNGLSVKEAFANLNDYTDVFTHHYITNKEFEALMEHYGAKSKNELGRKIFAEALERTKKK